MFKQTFLLPLLGAMFFFGACANEKSTSTSCPSDKCTICETCQTVRITLSPGPNFSMPLTATFNITAIAEPTQLGYTNADLLWNSSDLSVLTVDKDGRVTALKEGTATISAASKNPEDGCKPGKATITVIKNYRVEGTDFAMVPVAWEHVLRGRGIDFPTGTMDSLDFVSNKSTMNHRYALATTEVTYELWHKVKTWATTKAPQKYKFTSTKDGKEGNYGTIAAKPTARKKEPVTTMTWYDAMVWTNALTEYVNANYGTNYTTQYNDGTETCSIDPFVPSLTCPKPIRDAETAGERTKLDAFDVAPPVLAVGETPGFRLPTSLEWEFAARYQSTGDRGNSVGVPSNGSMYFFTKGNSASGATLPIGLSGLTLPSGKTWADLRDEAARVAVYDEWWNGTGWVDQTPATTSSASVGGKAANALGIYDMSGNVIEWCFDKIGPSRVVRGGSWYSYASDLRVGYVVGFSPGDAFDNLGFRLARTQ